MKNSHSSGNPGQGSTPFPSGPGDGKSEKRGNGRLGLVMAATLLVFATYSGRLILLGFHGHESPSAFRSADAAITATRPDIIDRNGKVLATDIITASLYADPKKIVDPDEATEQLTSALPDLDYKNIHKKLSSQSRFAWIRRELTPSQEKKIFSLGIPGINFESETRRFYPSGETAAHVVGYVDVDNIGKIGVEKYLDKNGLEDLRKSGLGAQQDHEPVQLSLDIRVQHVVQDELIDAMERYRAKSAGAVMVKVDTGEIIAMASLPGFDPNYPKQAVSKDPKTGEIRGFNRITNGLYEMGSTFKTFTSAMALDSGKIHLSTKFNATRSLTIGKHTIHDFHAKRRWLSVPEIFIYSSNIGTAQMALQLGPKVHKEFLQRIGILAPIENIQLLETKNPRSPKRWRSINSATISFGHGIQTTPLNTAMAAAAIVNDGILLQPTLFPRTAKEARQHASQVISEETSRKMRYLLRLNVEKGSGRRAEVKGYRVGGKTGTAEKVFNGKYDKFHLFNVFLSAFPMDDPQYVLLVFIDEPYREVGKPSPTAGLTAAPTVGHIIRRSAPMLGVEPKFLDHKGPLLVVH